MLAEHPFGYSPRIDRSRATLVDLARAWLVIGTQSVGGGPSTLHLIRREFVERRAWMSHRQFLEDYALSKLSLGINQIALAGLIGTRVAGARGLLVSLLALLVPSAAITLAMTAVYAAVREEPLVRAALSGAGPVTAGMIVGIAFSFARQTVRRGRRRFLDWVYALIAMAAGLVSGLPPIAVLGIGALVGVMLLRGESGRAGADPAL